jgi:hypothetical protein
MGVSNLIQLSRHVTNRFVPGCRNQFAAFLVTNQRRANAFFVIYKRMSKAALDAKKLAV